MNWDFINPKVGVNYHVNNSFKVYGSLGLTSREPTRTDIMQGEDNFPGYLVPDFYGVGLDYEYADVKTEKVFDKEFGITYNTKSLYLQANVYHMRFYDEIVLNGQTGSNGLALHSNVAKSIRYGVEIDAKYKVGDFIFNNTTSLSSNRIKDNGNETTHVMSPSFILNQDVIYNIGNFDLSARFRYQGRSFLNTENSTTIDGFNTVDLGATYSKDVYKVGIKVNNIFDTQYFAYGQINANGDPMYFVGVPTNVNMFVEINF
jgi:iron complex outermembrane receptor protein